MNRKVFISLIATLLIFISALPIDAHASHRSYYSSSIRTKINNLDDDIVKNIPVPILFGVTPDNIYPSFGDPRSGDRLHEGLDIMAPKGAPIVSPTEAVVIRTGDGDSSGYYVYTANPGGETFVYMHLDEIADIDEGDTLKKGDLIGYVGNTGNASGGATHLHFEIRDGGAIDPYSRIKSVFPLADKIEYLEEILDESDDEEELAENIVTLYRRELVLAQTLGILLPPIITKTMTTKIAVIATTITRTLRLGSVGEDVKVLQTNLGVTADGSFGPKTESALKAFQTSKGLTPDGVFGPATRAALLGSISTPTGCTATTLYSPTTGVKCPTISY